MNENVECFANDSILKRSRCEFGGTCLMCLWINVLYKECIRNVLVEDVNKQVLFD